MTLGTSIRLIADTATPALREKIAQYTPAQFAARVGPALQQLTAQHLCALGPNRRGWPTTHFYEKFARGVQWHPEANGVSVAILPAIIRGRPVGLGLRVFGGAITPQTAKMLAIPISSASYGHVPGDFPDLFLLKTLKGAYLVRRSQAAPEKSGGAIGRTRSSGNAGRRGAAELDFLFQLTASVTQTGDRNVLPSDRDILQTALNAARGQNN